MLLFRRYIEKGNFLPRAEHPAHIAQVQLADQPLFPVCAQDGIHRFPHELFGDLGIDLRVHEHDVALQVDLDTEPGTDVLLCIRALRVHPVRPGAIPAVERAFQLPVVRLTLPRGDARAKGPEQQRENAQHKQSVQPDEFPPQLFNHWPFPDGTLPCGWS